MSGCWKDYGRMAKPPGEPGEVLSPAMFTRIDAFSLPAMPDSKGYG